MEGSGTKRLVVIGNGMAGVAAVEELLALQAGPDAPAISITIFGEEPHVNYNRILLSDVLAGRRPVESIYLNSPAWYEEHRIDLRRGVRVTAIDPARQCVTDSTGAVTSYDRLLIAVGAAPFIPPIAGVEKPGVFVFRAIEDTEKIIARARKSRRAVVIGGGLLGLEAARGLINYGVSVTVVHLVDRLMEQQLDPVGGAMLKREIDRLGIEVRLNSSAVEICGEGAVEAVRLASGERLPADMVLICTGVRPDLALAIQAGLKTNRGIVVNDQMQASAAGIYAVGDVIEHRDRCYGLVAPLRDQARVAARMLARDLYGLNRSAPEPAYEGTRCATTLKVAGVNLTSAGEFISAPGGGDGCEELVMVDTQASIYKKLVFRSHRLVGMILLGDTREGPRLFQLIQSGEELSAKQKEQLLGRAAGDGAVAGSASPIASMADTDLICNCHGVTKGTILRAIQENGLKSRDEVAQRTNASTGCGSCAQLVDDLLAERKPKPLTGIDLKSVSVSKAGLPTSAPDPVHGKAVQGEPLPAGKPLTGYPLAYPRALEVERIKREGLGLDFDKIREQGVLALTEDDFYRLKTYGVCSQKHPGYFMLRIRIPGGRVTARQLTVLAELADTHGRGWGHLTTRQNLELHWVRLEEVPAIWERLETIGLSTRSACGHTLRNVMACPHAATSPHALIDAQPWAKAVTDYFVTRSDLINPAMPNRLNIYFAGCADCAAHAQINDIGFAAVRREGMIGFELWAGGSLGAHPILGFKLKEFLAPEEVLPACQAMFEIHTKYGNRNKAKSRLKFLIEQWGREKFASVFDRFFESKRSLPENRAFRLPTVVDGEQPPVPAKRLCAAVMRSFTGALPEGCFPQRQPGYARVAIHVPLGEVRAAQLAALAQVARRYGNGEIHFTKDQDVELHWVEARWTRRAARMLERAGLSLKGQRSELRVVACPGTEFCVLAVTNAQGAAKELLKTLQPRDPAIAQLLRGVSIAISGCPNSCAKHQIADIGLAGTMTTVGEERRYSYLLYLGGRLNGTIRLGEVARKGMTEEMVVPTVEALLALVAEQRQAGESFQEVIDRVGVQPIGALLEQRLAPFAPHAAATVEMNPDLVEAKV
ncbi:MAG: FAD-dependent oxidoreductase [Nitrospirota bacterium]